MKQINLALMAAAMLLLAACQKKNSGDNLPVNDDAAANAITAAAACQPVYFGLIVDPGTGFSYLFKVVGSPSAGPVSLSPVIGSAGSNQLTTCSGAPIKFATGISYEPASGTFYGTTGLPPSSPVNNILKFNDPNCVSPAAAVVSGCALSLNLSDIERDPVTGAYYAINRGTANPNNRVVKLGLPGSPTVSCLPNFLSPSLYIRGLTVTLSGKLYVMAVNGTGGRLLEISTASGSIVNTYSYPGPITPSPGVNIPEMGLHHDSLCIKRFITGNYDPVGPATLLTDGIPSGLPGGPVYTPLSGAIKPVVDFSRP
ncbi:hypothetical protein HHL16_11085 [Pseudoflavitalea sp. G-6-1-2]|uniref:hypothetical protein n=1 Tax=Pseudoflavitalea sp. G-6-1-2 TaxID=2728841 RepID=UPI00146F3673|nr:hypothetical protein [Pseudoflavitalea sp. G-6-1-2]NML21422.1 hypothetical protein [Pseudoflavitalea sp. G-6-1-2]